MTKVLTADKLTFDRGDSSFTPEEFTKTVSPYFKDLARVGRTNYLFAAVYPSGKPDITGYHTNTTINATINTIVTKCERLGGKWAVYRLD